MKYLLLLLTLAATPAVAQISVEDAWIRATPPGAKMAAGYMIIRVDSADRLLSVTSSAAERVEMHITVQDGDVLRMREVKSYDLPANSTLQLKPGGAHLMFVNIKAPMKDGTTVPATLKFQHLGTFEVEFQVRPLAGGEQHRH